MENKEKTEIAITIAGVIILAVVIVNSLKPDGSKKPSSQAKAPANAGASAAQKQTAEFIPAGQQELNLQKELSEKEWGLDPFSSSKAKREYRKADLFLKGITIGREKEGFAYINDEILKSGDFIGGYEIIAIEKDRIMLKKSGQVFYRVLSENK